jgi:hypothetical protein
MRCALSRAQATRSSLDRRTDMIVHTDKGGCVRRGLGAAHIRSWMRTRHADSRDVRGPLWRTGSQRRVPLLYRRSLPSGRVSRAESWLVHVLVVVSGECLCVSLSVTVVRRSARTRYSIRRNDESPGSSSVPHVFHRGPCTRTVSVEVSLRMALRVESPFLSV